MSKILSLHSTVVTVVPGYLLKPGQFASNLCGACCSFWGYFEGRMQTCQLSRLHCESHGFRHRLTVKVPDLTVKITFEAMPDKFPSMQVKVLLSRRCIIVTKVTKM